MKILTVCALIVYSVMAQANELGKKTYDAACKNCHSPRVAKSMKAPEAFDEAAWKKPMIAAQKATQNDPKKYPSAMSYLLYQVKIGKGLMHHGGLCKESGIKQDCSDDALQKAIHFMKKNHEKLKN
jgi:cytochrome c5